MTTRSQNDDLGGDAAQNAGGPRVGLVAKLSPFTATAASQDEEGRNREVCLTHTEVGGLRTDQHDRVATRPECGKGIEQNLPG